MKVRTVELERRSRSPGEFPRRPLPEIAFAGRSNVGKSSLINTLLNRKGLVGVSSTPGKTRAIDFFCVNDKLRFVDLPGYGFARVPKEVQERWKILIEAYLREREFLAAVVWILDIRREPSELDRMLQHWLQVHAVPFIPVCTKADKLSHSQRTRRGKEIVRRIDEAGEPLLFSAKTGLGKQALWGRMEAAIERHRTSGDAPRREAHGPPGEDAP